MTNPPFPLHPHYTSCPHCQRSSSGDREPCAENGSDELVKLFLRMSPDERSVTLTVARRIDTARGHYGALSLDDDPRDFVREGCEEAVDLAVYLAMATLRAKRTWPKKEGA